MSPLVGRGFRTEMCRRPVPRGQVQGVGWGELELQCSWGTVEDDSGQETFLAGFRKLQRRREDSVSSNPVQSKQQTI